MTMQRNGRQADRIPAPEARLGYEGQREPGFERQGDSRKRILRRGPWENASAVVIGLGILMQMQPFALELYTWSFAVIVAGTLGFVVTSHFPE